MKYLSLKKKNTFYILRFLCWRRCIHTPWSPRLIFRIPPKPDHINITDDMLSPISRELKTRLYGQKHKLNARRLAANLFRKEKYKAHVKMLQWDDRGRPPHWTFKIIIIIFRINKAWVIKKNGWYYHIMAEELVWGEVDWTFINNTYRKI